MRNAVFRPRFVSEITKADVLFREMKRERCFVAIVVDEYGGTDGLVTLNDLIEQIVGDLDESESQNDITERDGVYYIAGGADIESFEELFGFESEGESITVGGWIVEQLGRIPDVNDSLTYGDIELTVSNADGKRVLEVIAKRLETSNAPEL